MCTRPNSCTYCYINHNGQLTRPTPAEQQRLSQVTALVDLKVISRNFIYIKLTKHIVTAVGLRLCFLSCYINNLYFRACSERGKAAKCYIFKHQKSLLNEVV